MGKAKTSAALKKPSDVDGPNSPLLKVGVGPTEIRRQRKDVAKERVTIYDESMTRIVGHENRWKVQNPISKHFGRHEIGAAEVRAAERLTKDAEESNIGSKSCLDFDCGGGDIDIATFTRGESAVASYQSYRAAIDAMGQLASIVVWVAVAGRRASDWVVEYNHRTESNLAARSGVDLLKLGLTALVKHYGDLE